MRHNHELLFGPPSTFDGNNPRMYSSGRPPLVLQEVTRAIESRIDYDQEYRIVWSDGSIHWLAAKFFCDRPIRRVRMVGLSVGYYRLADLGSVLQHHQRKRSATEENLPPRQKNNLQIISVYLTSPGWIYRGIKNY